jgi:hypothetical protein
VVSHLDECPACRERAGNASSILDEFGRAYREGYASISGGGDAGRSRLLGRIRDIEHVTAADALASPGRQPKRRVPGVAVALLVAAISVGFAVWALRQDSDPPPGFLLKPDPALTGGATVAVRLADVCSQEQGEDATDGQMAPLSIARTVFADYGIRDAGQRIYELDYLIPPELGGSDDARNLWPQAYGTPVWNAHVKDALEAYLHRLVCRGEISLAAAQEDISADWIAAYRKHFGTEWPVADHLAFLKDEPWEE